jgi:hypothetical protein
MEKSGTPKELGRDSLRILRPLFWWLILVLVLFGIRTHQRLSEQTRLAFSISLQGRPFYGATINLDGQPFDIGNHISIGPHRLVISHPKTVSFSTNFFIWYGPHDMGEFKLERSQGTLSVQANPPAEKITITGPEFSTTLDDSAGSEFTVPTDQYTVLAEYKHWSQSQNVAVFADTTASGIFSPLMGALHMTCNRDGATYDLQNLDGQNADRGNLPATVTELPAGGYHLTILYHNRQMQKSIQVYAGVTNEVPLEFVFGAARIESTPSGADVRTANGDFLGQTPLDLPEITPQKAQLNLSLNGYEPVSVALEITADQTNYCRTNLMSINYLATMRNARAYLAVSNYDAALQAAGEALDAKPGDADALALQAEASGPVNAERERVAQLKRPREVFDYICSQSPESRYFAEHELTTSKPAKDVEAAIVRSLQASPQEFQILYDELAQPETYKVAAHQTFSLGILGGTERACLVVVGKTKDDETQILFKVVEYQIQHELVNFRDVKHLIPVQQSRMQMNEIQQQVQEGIRTVTQRIQSAIQQVQ